MKLGLVSLSLIILEYFRSFKASHPFSAIMASIVIIIFSSKLEIPLSLAIPLIVDIMLIQFLTGMINDYLDADSDSQFQPEKPLVRGMLSKNILRRTIIILFGAILLVTFIYFPLKVIMIIFGGLFFAQTYNFGLKDTPLSIMAFDISFGIMAILPFILSRLNIFDMSLQFLLSGGIIASILHISNSLIDFHTDQQRGSNSFVQWLNLVKLRYLVIIMELILTFISITSAYFWIMIGINVIATILLLMMLSSKVRDKREDLYYVIVLLYLFYLWVLPYR